MKELKYKKVKIDRDRMLLISYRVKKNTTNIMDHGLYYIFLVNKTTRKIEGFAYKFDKVDSYDKKMRNFEIIYISRDRFGINEIFGKSLVEELNSNKYYNFNNLEVRRGSLRIGDDKVICLDCHEDLLNDILKYTDNSMDNFLKYTDDSDVFLNYEMALYIVNYLDRQNMRHYDPNTPGKLSIKTKNNKKVLCVTLYNYTMEYYYSDREDRDNEYDIMRSGEFLVSLKADYDVNYYERNRRYISGYIVVDLLNDFIIKKDVNNIISNFDYANLNFDVIDVNNSDINIDNQDIDIYYKIKELNPILSNNDKFNSLTSYNKFDLSTLNFIKNNNRLDNFMIYYDNSNLLSTLYVDNIEGGTLYFDKDVLNKITDKTIVLYNLKRSGTSIDDVIVHDFGTRNNYRLLLILDERNMHRMIVKNTVDNSISENIRLFFR